MAQETFENIYQHLILNESGPKKYRAKTSEGIWGYVVDNGGPTIHGVRWKYWRIFLQEYGGHDFFKNERWKNFWDYAEDGQEVFNPNLFKKKDFKQLSSNDVKFFYHKEYWDKVNGDALPLGLDYYLFDFGVNSGPATAVKHIQRIVGVFNDGICGVNTINAIHQYVDRNGLKETINDLDKARREFMLSLSVSSQYMGGWDKRLLNVVRKCYELINIVYNDKRKPIVKSRTISTAKKQAIVAGAAIGAHNLPITQNEAHAILDQLNTASFILRAIDGIYSYGFEIIMIGVIGFAAYLAWLRWGDYFTHDR